MASSPMIQAEGICRDFGPVRVLFDVDFDVMPGEVHAVIGENGAGKSTLMRILCGYLPPSEGRLYVKGEPVRFSGIAEGERRGITMIHQEFNLAPDLTVEENIFLGQEIRKWLFLDKREMQTRARRVLQELQTDVDPRTRVRDLSVSDRQMVEIAKAVTHNAEVLIMDEPTAVLTTHEIETLFGLIQRLVSSGVAVIYISHKLSEVRRISDRVTILRDGHRVATENAPDLTEDRMAALMVGRDLKDMFPEKVKGGGEEIVLSVRDVVVPGRTKPCSFELRRGEILGFAGLVGSGRTELMEGIFGLRPISQGTILRDGQPVRIRSMADAIGRRMVYLPEDRKGKGLLTSKTMRENLTLLSLEKFGHPLIDRKAETEALARAVETFEIRAPHPEARVDTLSGGNQQKLALAKIMEVDPEIIVFDEPTRGIDVGTKRQIYQFIRDLAQQGRSIIVVSSELQEIIGLCHRAVVMRSGAVAGVLTGEAITEEEIMLYATGVKGAA